MLIALPAWTLRRRPTAFDLTLTVPEDGVAEGMVTATDPDSAALSMAVVTQPQKGTVVRFHGTRPYAPDNSFVTLLASDELGASENVLYALNVLDPTQIIPLNGSGVGSLPQLTPSPDR